MHEVQGVICKHAVFLDKVKFAAGKKTCMGQICWANSIQERAGGGLTMGSGPVGEGNRLRGGGSELGLGSPGVRSTGRAGELLVLEPLLEVGEGEDATAPGLAQLQMAPGTGKRPEVVGIVQIRGRKTSSGRIQVEDGGSFQNGTGEALQSGREREIVRRGEERWREMARAARPGRALRAEGRG